MSSSERGVIITLYTTPSPLSRPSELFESGDGETSEAGHWGVVRRPLKPGLGSVTNFSFVLMTVNPVF